MHYWLYVIYKIFLNTICILHFNYYTQQLVYPALSFCFKWHCLTYCKLLLCHIGHVVFVKYIFKTASTHYGFLRDRRFQMCVLYSNKRTYERLLYVFWTSAGAMTTEQWRELLYAFIRNYMYITSI